MVKDHLQEEVVAVERSIKEVEVAGQQRLQQSEPEPLLPHIHPSLPYLMRFSQAGHLLTFYPPRD